MIGRGVYYILYYLPSTFTPIGKRAFIFISPCSPEAKLDFVTKLSRIHGNIMRTNQMTGNIIVSTCCLGDMAVNAPSSSGCALGHGGRLQPYHPRKHELTITYIYVFIYCYISARTFSIFQNTHFQTPISAQEGFSSNLIAFSIP